MGYSASLSGTKSRIIDSLQSNAATLNKLETWCERSLVKWRNRPCIWGEEIPHRSWGQQAPKQRLQEMWGCPGGQ